MPPWKIFGYILETVSYFSTFFFCQDSIFYIIETFIITITELYWTITHQILVSKTTDPDRVSVNVLKAGAKLFHYH